MIQTAHSDSDPLGSEIKGTTANPLWDLFLPAFMHADSVWVTIYVKYDLAHTFTIINHISHPIASSESMVLDISFKEEMLRFINVYHWTPDGPGHNLLHILSSELDPLIPTLLIGNFNMHAFPWSFPHSTISPWASDLVNWFDDQGLEYRAAM